MPSFVVIREIPASADRVFAALADPASALRLFGGVTRSELVGPGPVRAGSRIARTRSVGSQTAALELEVLVFRPGKEIELRGSARGLTVGYRYLLRAAADPAATAVACEVSVEGAGMASFIEGVVLDALRKADADHLDRLAAAVG